MKTQDLSEFESGMEYDAQYDKHYEYGIALIQSHISAMDARSLLDVCCGTGIVTIPVAKGLDCAVGIDIAEGMLKQAKRKAQRLGNLSFLQQDATKFSLDKRFDMAIMTGNAFQAFLSDEMLADVLHSISNHLEKGGRFLFDTRLPTSENLEIDSEMSLWQTYQLPDKGEVKYMGMSEHYDDENAILYLKKVRHYQDGTTAYSSIDLKYRQLDEIEVFLEQAGFRVIEKFGSWTEEKLTVNSNNLICVAEKF
ncbi:methyltransferase [Vibrio hyugaensis]|uniref:Methyltransferase n=1 Tax=Vibrio hyugaensis TaxID=1534743 RepID=A0ABQ5Y266_9VIBR|nr:class I SAM-dependent methyltransferase [Vibrio hyugaensis]GLR03210.1 methyltransferase [Vibrio hyugaensis]